VASKKAQSWQEKVLNADKIWAQVKYILQSNGLDLPKTPRRPDVRIILNNISGTDKLFRNPGDHSSKAEHVPATGDKTAAMVMVKSDTLADQFASAAKLVARYNLEQDGLSAAFVQALQSGEALDLVSEAYGPAPFEGQASKLVNVSWQQADGTIDAITPVQGTACAYGARAATDEKAFLTELVIFVQGTSTNAELIEGSGMVVAVSEDWQTKMESTRPIVPSVAKGFYGKHYANIPVVSVSPDGLVQSIDLKNGIVIELVSDYQVTTPVPKIG